MDLITQYKLKQNPIYIKYLRENSYWYKHLNRDPNLFTKFEEEVKEKYKLRPIDRISKTLDLIETLETIINTFN